MLNVSVIVGKIKYIGDNYIIMNDKSSIDEVKVELSPGLYKNLMPYVSVGTTIGVKGKLISKNDKTYIMGEKVTLLASERSNE